MNTVPASPDRPTVITEQVGRRNVAFGAGMALLLFAIVSPMLRDDPIDVGTQIAIGALVIVALGVVGVWVHIARNPRSLVISDDEIRLEPSGDLAARCIARPSGGLRLAKEGSVRSKTLILSSLEGGTRLPLHFMSRQDIVDACYAHGWAFGEPDDRQPDNAATR